MEEVKYKSQGEDIVANLLMPKNYEKGKQYPAVIITGAWTTVKEQMVSHYAKELSNRGYVTLIFDFRGWGESISKEKYLENPKRKIEDISASIDYMTTRSEVLENKIFGLGICASSGYMAKAALINNRIKSIALIAPWLHNQGIVNQVYGGAESVDQLIKMSQEAEKSNKPVIIEAASMTNERAVMYKVPYYTEKNRGLIPEYDNKFNIASWEGWLKFDGIIVAEQLKKSTLIIHSEAAAIPQGAKLFAEKMGRNAIEIWYEDVSQFDFYDKKEIIHKSVNAVDQHFLSLVDVN